MGLNYKNKKDVNMIFSNDFHAYVIVEKAPINEKYWNVGDIALIYNGQIRLGGCWFNFDDRYKVELKN